ncbi:MAG: hypothetical protein KDC31_12435, partial [Saprospiraceae bacterium]|nr:hypothetical protein [Saprospiraceae bacterium]
LFSKDRFNRTSREEEDHIWQGSIDPMIREEPDPLYVIPQEGINYKYFTPLILFIIKMIISSRPDIHSYKNFVTCRLNSYNYSL